MDRCKHHFLGWSQESSSPGSDRFFKHYFLPHPTPKRGQEAIFSGDRETGHPVSNISRLFTSGCYSFLRCHSFPLSFYSGVPFWLFFLRGPSLPPGHLGRACVHTHSHWPDRLRGGAWDHLQWEPHSTEWPTLPAQLTQRLTSSDFSITNPIFFLKAHLSTD